MSAADRIQEKPAGIHVVGLVTFGTLLSSIGYVLFILPLNLSKAV
jgi:hypothetical protein